MAAPERAAIAADADSAQPVTPAASDGLAESEQEFERRTTAAMRLPAAAPAGPADPSAAAGGDRALRPAARRIPGIRAQRPGAVPEGARVRRAGADRRGDGDDAEPHRRESRTRRTTTKSSSGAASTSSPAGSSSRPRTPTRRSSAWAPTPRTTSSRSTSSAGRSTSRNSTRRRCTSTWRCSTTRSRPATTSTRARGRRGAARRGHLPRHQPRLLEPRRA